MKTLLIHEGHQPPAALRSIVEAGSTEVTEMKRDDVPASVEADRVVVWNGRELRFEDRRLRWPEDEDELKVLLQTGG